MNGESKVLSTGVAVLLSLSLSAAKGKGQTQTVPFVEPDDGRSPLTDGLSPLPGGINQAKSVDLYIFKICEGVEPDIQCDPILNSIVAVANQPGGSARVLLEPCPGGGANCDPGVTGPVPVAMRACNELLAAGSKVLVKSANPGDDTLGILRAHAKSFLVDDGIGNKKAFILTPNLVPSSLDPATGMRRDYGTITNDMGVINSLSAVFAHDWGPDDETNPPISDCGDFTQWSRPGQGLRGMGIADPLIISPDRLVENPDGTFRTFARERILRLIDSATTSLKIQVETISPVFVPMSMCGMNDSDDEILPLLRRKAQQLGPNLQVLLGPDDPRSQCNQLVINAIEAVAPGQARIQSMISTPGGGSKLGKPHAKLIVVDGQRVYVGSHNLTRKSMDQRREIGRIVNNNDSPETVMTFQRKFDDDWAANPPPPTP